ncbi:unknown [Bacteroides sp. CAG:1060]|nr:unknown [Bacteroides sp. CAG:1060]
MGMINDYELFGAAMNCGFVRGGSFDSFCRILRLCPFEIDEMLVSELGLSGEEIFLKYWSDNYCI